MGKKELLTAVKNNDINKARKIIAKGISVNICDEFSRSLLSLAIWHNHTEMSAFLIASGADVNAQDHVKWTPIIYAARNGNLELSKFLLEHGADAHLSDADGLDAIDMAMTNKNSAIVEMIDSFDKAKTEVKILDSLILPEIKQNHLVF